MTGDPEGEKLDEMALRIREAGLKREARLQSRKEQPVTMSRIGFDFIGAVLGGTFLGWLADQVMPQLAPWGLIVMILVGFGGGIMNVWRALAGPKST
jgi:F0F1-type ATP synthase assembly protein I